MGARLEGAPPFHRAEFSRLLDEAREIRNEILDDATYQGQPPVQACAIALVKTTGAIASVSKALEHAGDAPTKSQRNAAKALFKQLNDVLDSAIAQCVTPGIPDFPPAKKGSRLFELGKGKRQFMTRTRQMARPSRHGIGVRRDPDEFEGLGFTSWGESKTHAKFMEDRLDKAEAMFDGWMKDETASCADRDRYLRGIEDNVARGIEHYLSINWPIDAEDLAKRSNKRIKESEIAAKLFTFYRHKLNPAIDEYRVQCLGAEPGREIRFNPFDIVGADPQKPTINRPLDKTEIERIVVETRKEGRPLRANELKRLLLDEETGLPRMVSSREAQERLVERQMRKKIRASNPKSAKKRAGRKARRKVSDVKTVEIIRPRGGGKSTKDDD